MARLFLGIDSSTQSITGSVIDLDSRALVFEHSVNFDEALPAYGTRNGVLVNEDQQIVHTPPALWIEALEILLAGLREVVNIGSIQAVSGSGQQHGSVYLNETARPALAALDPSRSLVDQLGGIFSRATSPIWMDSSTHEECAEIREALGGLQQTTAITGSNTFERFTGPQIRKFFKREPEAYEKTTDIALVSSFICSVLCGEIAPIDHGDGAGMNLMDILRKTWHEAACEATAPGLADKLPPLVASDSICGKIHPYFTARYGFHPEAKVAPFSGDNPSSVIGTGLVDPGMVAISLGTSDTYFGTMAEFHMDPNGEGHVFGSPTGDYMTLICFKNGSLAREKVRDAYGLDWPGFSDMLKDTPPGNGGKLLLPWFAPEIVPTVLTPGVKRRELDPLDVPGNCRAVVEAQMMSMRIHSEWMGIRPGQIYATGGASSNQEILQVMANVHACPVYQFTSTNGASLGAALRAAQACLGDAGSAPAWRETVKGFTDPIEGSQVRPQSGAVAVYDDLVKAYAAFENENRS
jgi:xylulokinase